MVSITNLFSWSRSFRGKLIGIAYPTASAVYQSRHQNSLKKRCEPWIDRYWIFIGGKIYFSREVRGLARFRSRGLGCGLFFRGTCWWKGSLGRDRLSRRDVPSCVWFHNSPQIFPQTHNAARGYVTICCYWVPEFFSQHRPILFSFFFPFLLSVVLNFTWPQLDVFTRSTRGLLCVMFHFRLILWSEHHLSTFYTAASSTFRRFHVSKSNEKLIYLFNVWKMRFSYLSPEKRPAIKGEINSLNYDYKHVIPFHVKMIISILELVLKKNWN